MRGRHTWKELFSLVVIVMTRFKVITQGSTLKPGKPREHRMLRLLGLNIFLGQGHVCDRNRRKNVVAALVEWRSIKMIVLIWTENSSSLGAWASDVTRSCTRKVYISNVAKLPVTLERNVKPVFLLNLLIVQLLLLIPLDPTSGNEKD